MEKPKDPNAPCSLSMSPWSSSVRPKSSPVGIAASSPPSPLGSSEMRPSCSPTSDMLSGVTAAGVDPREPRQDHRLDPFWAGDDEVEDMTKGGREAAAVVRVDGWAM